MGENHDITNLARKGKSPDRLIVSPLNADPTLRGYRGLLLVLAYGSRPGDPDDMKNAALYRALGEISRLDGISTWTEKMP